MDDFFAGLSKQQTMLLLTAVTFGGQESMQALEHLPDDQSELLRERADRILKIPREQRVPFLVQEIKRIVTRNKTESLRGASSSLVAQALTGERASVVEVLLRALPAQLAEEVRRASARPAIKLSRDIRPDLLAVLRWKFEEKLARVSQPRSLALTDLPRLSTPELWSLSDALGSRLVAPALAAVDERERAALLALLGPDQRAGAERPAVPGRRMGHDLARRWIESIFGVPDPKQAVRELGVRRIARACLSSSAELALKVIESHRDDFGRSLALFVAEERQTRRRPSSDEASRNEVLEELEKLAARGAIGRPAAPPAQPPARPKP